MHSNLFFVRPFSPPPLAAGFFTLFFTPAARR
jgi:hypothetical protein